MIITKMLVLVIGVKMTRPWKVNYIFWSLNITLQEMLYI